MSSFVTYLFEPDEDPITTERMCGLEPMTPEEEYDHQRQLAERRHLHDLDHLPLSMRVMRFPDRAAATAPARGGLVTPPLAPARPPSREAA